MQLPNGAKQISATVADISGRTVWQYSGNSANVQIDNRGMSPGIYMLKLTVDNKANVFKLVK